MISVCMATYNGARYIREQMDSITPQLGKNDEIIISDDGSSDETISIIESLKDSRITVYKNSFKNVLLNFEFIIKKAKGDYIFLTDQDDVWHKDKVKCYMECFLKKNNVLLILSDIQIIDKDGLYSDKIFYKKQFTNNLFKNILKNNFIGCNMAITREAKKIILPFPSGIAMHDWWIGSCCKMFGGIFFINKKLHFYRRHNSNVTKEKREKFIVGLIWRLNLVHNLVVRYFKIRINKKK